MANRRTGVKPLKNGRFQARYFRGYDAKTGKRVYPAKRFDTAREAREWLAEELTTRSSRYVEGQGTLTLGTYLDHWLANTKTNLRENSRRMYESMINVYIKPMLGNTKIARLTATQIESWQSELLKKNLSQTTVTNARTVLHGALKDARRKNIVRGNVIEATDGPGLATPKRYPLTIDEALSFLDACKCHRFGLMYEFALTCGLRPEEVRALRWEDLDLSGTRGRVRIRRVVIFLKGGGWRWHEPKTKNGNRSISFPASLSLRLAEHRKTQLQKKLKAGQLWENNDLVFATRQGRPIQYSEFYGHFKTLLEKAELPSTITPYTMRHAFVTFSLVAGVDAKTVSNEAGHATVGFTLTKYGHVLDEMHETASDKRESLLRSRKR